MLRLLPLPSVVLTLTRPPFSAPSPLRSYGRLQASKSSLTISVSAFGFGGSDTTEDSSSDYQGFNRSSAYLGRQSEGGRL